MYVYTVFMCMYAQNTGHATKEVSQLFTEAHKPQRGAQRMSARVFESICRFFEDNPNSLSHCGGNGRQPMRPGAGPAGPSTCSKASTHASPRHRPRGASVRLPKNNFGKLTKRGHICPVETVVCPVGLTPSRRALPETC